MDDGPSIIAVFILFSLLAVSVIGYLLFVAAALAISRARATRITDLAQNKKFGALSAVHILHRSDAYLVSTQAGRFISVLIAGMILSELLERLPEAAQALYFTLSATYAPRWFDWGVNVLLMGLFIPATLISVQVLKTLSLQFPDAMLCLIANPLRWMHLCFGPLVLCVHGIVGAFLAALGVKVADERDLALSADDVSEFVRRSSQDGVLERTEQELIEGVVELSETIVREVMTPRADAVFVLLTASITDIVRTIQREGVSRVLVCGKDLDDVRGMIIGKELLVFVGAVIKEQDWHHLIREVTYVPNTKSVTALLGEFREKRIHLAVVLDEHGGVDGVVTLEDLVEEIVGDIGDEFDSPAHEPQSIIQFDGAMIIDAALTLYELQKRHGVELPDGDYETVAGFVLAQLGHVPVVGESFTFEGSEFTVRDVQQHRVVKISMRRSQPNKIRQEELNATRDSSESLPLAVDSD